MYIFKRLLLKNPLKIISIFVIIYFINAIITQSEPAVYNEKFEVESVSYIGDKMIVSNGTDTKIFDKDQTIINNVIYYKNYDLLGIIIIATTIMIIILVSSFITTDNSINWGLTDIKMGIVKSRIEMVKIDHYYYFIDTETDRIIYKSTYSEDKVPSYQFEEYFKNPENFVIYTTPTKKRDKSIDSILN